MPSLYVQHTTHIQPSYNSNNDLNQYGRIQIRPISNRFRLSADPVMDEIELLSVQYRGRVGGTSCSHTDLDKFARISGFRSRLGVPRGASACLNEDVRAVKTF